MVGAESEVWFVYILKSLVIPRLYTGITLDPEHRLRQHNGLLRGGARATRMGKPWLIVYREGPMSKGDALRREAAIKKLGRKAKIALCSGV